MRRLLLIVGVGALLLAACSSGKHNASSTTSTTYAVSAAAKAKACAAHTQLSSAASELGDTQAGFRAVATSMRGVAAEVPTAAPDSLKSQALAMQTALINLATQLDAAKTRDDATAAVGNFLYHHSTAVSQYADWWNATCK